MDQAPDGAWRDQQAAGLGALLKQAMVHGAVSLRELSRLSGISAASLSRIISGKQRVKRRHLELFSRHLQIPMEQLLRSAGAIDHLREPDSMEALGELLRLFGFDIRTIRPEVSRELIKCEQYAKTPAGEKMILEQFAAKIASTNGVGAVIDKLNELYEAFCAAKMDAEKRAIVGGCLLYFILPTSVIPDCLFPIGFLDDAIAVGITAERVGGMQKERG
ncbi:MAG: DUF1232 domain-containing protein [Firmicutes bacterium]|nr:DUF1232 domain-containing protein [Bacillota bacterium]